MQHNESDANNNLISTESSAKRLGVESSSQAYTSHDCSDEVQIEMYRIQSTASQSNILYIPPGGGNEFNLIDFLNFPIN